MHTYIHVCEVPLNCFFFGIGWTIFFQYLSIFHPLLPFYIFCSSGELWLYCIVNGSYGMFLYVFICSMKNYSLQQNEHTIFSYYFLRFSVEIFTLKELFRKFPIKFNHVAVIYAMKIHLKSPVLSNYG